MVRSVTPKHRKRNDPILPKGTPPGDEEGISEPSGDVDVNLGVDIPWDLVENDALSKAADGGNYGVRALARGTHNPTERFLNKLRHDGDEFGALMAAVKGLCHSDRRDHDRFARPGRGAGAGIYEFKKKRMTFRLFSFYAEDCGLGASLVICADGFTKTKESKDEQDREFVRAARIRDEFLAHRRGS